MAEHSDAAILMEIRLCNFEYEGQERTPQTRFDMLLEKAAKLEAESMPFVASLKKDLQKERSGTSNEVAVSSDSGAGVNTM